MNVEQAYIDLAEQCRDLLAAYDIKLYEPAGELNGHHYLAREQKQHAIDREIHALRRMLWAESGAVDITKTKRKA